MATLVTIEQIAPELGLKPNSLVVYLGKARIHAVGRTPTRHGLYDRSAVIEAVRKLREDGIREETRLRRQLQGQPVAELIETTFSSLPAGIVPEGTPRTVAGLCQVLHSVANAGAQS